MIGTCHLAESYRINITIISIHLLIINYNKRDIVAVKAKELCWEVIGSNLNNGVLFITSP